MQIFGKKHWAKRTEDDLASLQSCADQLSLMVKEFSDAAAKLTPQHAADLRFELAQQVYNARRARAAFFNPDLFGEPGWDILLDLYIAHHQQKKISVTSACIGAAAPSTTALRWLRVLVEAKVIERTGDPSDLRRAFLSLSKNSLQLLDDYFDQMAI